MNGIVISRNSSSTRDVRLSISKVETATQNIQYFSPGLQSQAYYWTAEWQRGEREADREIRLGKTKRFSSAEEAIRWLKS